MIVPGSSPSRRAFLRAGLAAGGAGLLHPWTAAWASAREQTPGSVACPDPFAHGQLIGTVPFSGADRNPPFHTLLGSGLDARLYTDLSALTPETLVTPNERFFVRTAYPDLLDPAAAWKIRVNGLVRRARDLTLRDLEPLAEASGPHIMECAGNNDPANFGLMSAARWDGVPLARLFDRLEPLRQATRMRISGFDRHSGIARSSLPGASWIFTFDELAASGAFLATRMNGQPLPRDHGWPLRLIVPGWYGCTCIKWVDELTLVDETSPATTHMKEFAARTLQDGVSDLARDYRPASMDLSAAPVRVEKWRLRGRLVYRVVGIVWGGRGNTSTLRIRFNPSEPYAEVAVCPPVGNATMWTLWSHPWTPGRPGLHRIVLQPDGSAGGSRRLDLHFYAREVWIDDVTQR